MFPIRRKAYRHLNTITISRDALLKNHRNIQMLHPGVGVCPVLKSNAYGHGIKKVAPLFDAMRCPFLIVDSLYEAYELYKLRVKTPVLILGYTAPANFTVKRLPFDITVFDLEVARVLNTHQPGCRIHIFVDTGMSREGIGLSELPSFLSEIKKLENLAVVGLCSHFSDADNPSSQRFTQVQVRAFKKALAVMKECGFSPKWRHISASGGAMKIRDSTFNMMRVGIAHYGISPLEERDAQHFPLPLRPVLAFHTTLTQVKEVPKGSSVGYNRTFVTPKRIVIGILPAGYYEGVDRRLSNAGVVKIRGRYFPIIGKVSMNMTTVDITQLEHPVVGEDVIVYSSTPSDINSIEQAARLAGTIPYDLLVHLAESVKRVVV